MYTFDLAQVLSIGYRANCSVCGARVLLFFNSFLLSLRNFVHLIYFKLNFDVIVQSPSECKVLKCMSRLVSKI